MPTRNAAQSTYEYELGRVMRENPELNRGEAAIKLLKERPALYREYDQGKQYFSDTSPSADEAAASYRAADEERLLREISHRVELAEQLHGLDKGQATIRVFTENPALYAKYNEIQMRKR